MWKHERGGRPTHRCPLLPAAQHRGTRANGQRQRRPSSRPPSHRHPPPKKAGLPLPENDRACHIMCATFSPSERSPYGKLQRSTRRERHHPSHHDQNVRRAHRARARSVSPASPRSDAARTTTEAALSLVPNLADGTIALAIAWRKSRSLPLDVGAAWVPCHRDGNAAHAQRRRRELRRRRFHPI